MNPTMTSVSKLLTDSGYKIGELATRQCTATTFESDSVLGFVLYYNDIKTLVSNWSAHSTLLFDHVQFELRAAGDKAWNTYLILLANEDPDYAESVVLESIEEDLVGTRKIARAGVTSSAELRDALLPLLPLQNPPKLGKVDMEKEIRQRTPELSDELVSGFLSRASDVVLLEILERSE